MPKESKALSFWSEKWSLILSGGCGHYQSLMLECNCTTMALINRACSWALYLPSLRAYSHLRSLHCKLTLQARSSHGWLLSFKYLTKRHPLQWFIQTFPLLLVLRWLQCFHFKPQMHSSLVYLAVQIWATNLLNLFVCLYDMDIFVFILHYFKKELRQPNLLILFRCFPFVVP